MVHPDTAFGHHFLEVAQAQRVRHISPHTQQDHIQRLAQAFNTLPMPAGNVLPSVFFFLAIAFVIDIGPRILPQGLIATLPEKRAVPRENAQQN